MFYFPNVLNYKTGCFATIWLAATKARKMNRRDLLKVNVPSTCTDIMNYVLVRVPPLAAGLPRPRFSLYLSSQLQYGVVLVFHRQCQLLLDEIQEAIDRLHRYRVQAQIDMLPEETRTTQMLPDALALLNESEGARDPFFGSMEFGMPSPSSLMQLAQEMGVISPESPHPPVEGITASQELITMTEQEPVIMQEPEFEGAELQEIDMIEMLLEQSDQFPEGEEAPEREAKQARQRERREREKEREREEAVEREQERAEVERTRDLTGSTLLELAQSTEVPSRDVVSVGEDVELSTVMPEPAERERTPEPVPSPPSPPSPGRRARRRESPCLEELVPIPAAPVEGRRRRKRQLVFMDEETQISQEALQVQINDPSIETRPLEVVLIRPPSQVSKSKVLLSNPCMKFPAEILELWKQGVVITPIPPRRRRREAEEEDLEIVRERQRGREETEEGELREMPTEIVESGISRYDTPVSSLVMEVTDREISPLETPETRRSPVPVSVGGLEDIPEERVPELEDVTMDVDPLRQMVAIGEDEVTFHSLLPPRVKRRTVAQAFWRLLERVDGKEVTVRQDEPYDDIIISVTQQPRPIETQLV